MSQRTDSRSRIKSDRPTRLTDQIRRAPLTPDTPEKHQIAPHKIAARHRLPISKQK